ncbi:MAG: PAS domain-containing protein [Zetaproteobacteria bacterium]|nr:PAS domain-containing protein [Zetaproteobacteria bacterium]
MAHTEFLYLILALLGLVAGFLLFRNRELHIQNLDLSDRVHAQADELDAFTVLMVFDESWSLVHVNSMFERRFGLSQEAVLYKPFSLDQQNEAGGRRSRAYFESIRSAVNRDGLWQGQLYLHDHKGVPFWLFAKIVVQSQHEQTHYVLTGVDVTELVTSKERSREQTAFGQEILKTMPMALIVAEHRHNRIVFWNDASSDLFHLASSQVLMHPVSDMDVEWNEKVLQAIDSATEMQMTSEWLEQTIVRNDTSKSCNVRVMPIVVSNIRANLIMITDVTTIRAMEQRLRVTGRMEAMGEMAAGVAHEINSPLQFVKNNLHFLHDEFEMFQSLDIHFEDEKIAEEWDILKQDFPEAIAHSINGVERIATIVSSMRMLSHPGDGSIRRFDLKQMIHDSAIITKNTWKYVAELHTNFEEHEEPFFCYPELSQVFINLIVNAAHAIEEKNIKNSAEGEMGHINIATHWLDDAVVIRFSDTGCGIPNEKKTRIFDAFYTTKEPGKGTGQGLAISHDVVVRRHGGALSVESVEGQGTTFVVKIPFLKDKDPL